MMTRLCLVVALCLLYLQSFAASPKSGSMGPDSIEVSVGQSSFRSQTGIWWPSAAKNATSKAKKSQKPLSVKRMDAPVVVWFHGGMSGSNCAKGLVAGADFAELNPGKIVVSVSACRENHWVTKTMMDVVDAALDSVANRRQAPVERVSLVGVSDGALGVIVYSLEGRRTVEDRLLMSSFGGFLGEPAQIASQKKMQLGRYRFLQGGKDRLYPSEKTVPWITDFCKAVQVDCELRFDPEGEHDWSYWKDKHMDWIRDAIRP